MGTKGVGVKAPDTVKELRVYGNSMEIMVWEDLFLVGNMETQIKCLQLCQWPCASQCGPTEKGIR